MALIEDIEQNPARNLLDEARILEEQGNFQEALKVYLNLEKSLRESGEKKNLLSNLLNEGWLLLHKLNEIDKACEKYLEAEKLCNEVKGSGPLKLILHDLAYIFLKKEDKQKAILKYSGYLDKKKADKLYDKFKMDMADDKEWQIRLSKMKKRKSIENIIKFPDRQIVEYTELEVLGKMIREIEIRGNNIYAEASKLYHEKNNKEAIVKYDEYVSLNLLIGNKANILSGLIMMGRSMVRMKQYKEACSAYKSAEIYCRGQHLMNKYFKECLTLQSVLLINELDNFDEALTKYGELEVFCRQNDDDKLLLDCLHQQSWILFEKSGNYEMALQKAEEAEILSEKQRQWELYNKSLTIQVKILKAWGDKKAAKAKKKNLKKIS